MVDRSLETPAATDRTYWWRLYKANPRLMRRVSFPHLLALQSVAVAHVLFLPDPPEWAPEAGPLPLLPRQQAVMDRLGRVPPAGIPQPRPAAEIANLLASLKGSRPTRMAHP